MELAYRKLSEAEIAAALELAPGWEIVNGLLHREFQFESYLAGADSARKIAEIAEKLDHHPDILIGYRKVDVSVNTHSVNGISPYDFELAQQIDAMIS